MTHPTLATLAFLDNGMELLLIMVVILVLFGGKGMPEVMRGLGKTIRDFKRATSGVEEQLKRAIEEETSLMPRKKSSKKRKKNIAAVDAAAATTTATTPVAPVVDGADATNTGENADADAGASANEAGTDADSGSDYDDAYRPYEEANDDVASEQPSASDAPAAPQTSNDETSDGGGI